MSKPSPEFETVQSFFVLRKLFQPLDGEHLYFFHENSKELKNAFPGFSESQIDNLQIIYKILDNFSFPYKEFFTRIQNINMDSASHKIENQFNKATYILGDKFSEEMLKQLAQSLKKLEEELLSRPPTQFSSKNERILINDVKQNKHKLTEYELTLLARKENKENEFEEVIKDILQDLKKLHQQISLNTTYTPKEKNLKLQIVEELTMRLEGKKPLHYTPKQPAELPTHEQKLKTFASNFRANQKILAPTAGSEENSTINSIKIIVSRFLEKIGLQSQNFFAPKPPIPDASTSSIVKNIQDLIHQFKPK